MIRVIRRIYGYRGDAQLSCARYNANGYFASGEKMEGIRLKGQQHMAAKAWNVPVRYQKALDCHF